MSLVCSFLTAASLVGMFIWDPLKPGCPKLGPRQTTRSQKDDALYQAGQDTSIWSRRVFFLGKGRKIHPVPHFPPAPLTAILRGESVK